MDNKRKVRGYLFGFLGLIYLLARGGPLMPFIQSNSVRNVVVPLLWVGCILMLYFKVQKPKKIGKIKYNGKVWLWAFNCGIVWILIQLGLGFLLGFGKSPYAHTVVGIMRNIVTVGLPLVGGECIRSYMIHSVTKDKRHRMMISITIVMILLDVDMTRFLTEGSVEKVVTYGAEQLLPSIGHQMLGTVLVAYGGAIGGIIYAGMVQGFEWLTPILPDINWLMRGVVGIVMPLLAMNVVMQHYEVLSKRVKTYKEPIEGLGKWLPSAILSVLFIWFTVGVFPIYPSAIATGSMQPMIDPGDVVIIQKMQEIEDLEGLKVGDTIQFKRGDILINHRIIEIVEGADGLLRYRTKGDNNSVEDPELVEMNDVKGIIIGVIPKIGWPTLLFKQEKEEVPEHIVF